VRCSWPGERRSVTPASWLEVAPLRSTDSEGLVDRGGLEWLCARFVRLPDPLRASYRRLNVCNGPGSSAERFRKGLPTSIDELEWRSPILMRLDELGLAPNVTFHSIIADRRRGVPAVPPPPGSGRTGNSSMPRAWWRTHFGMLAGGILYRGAGIDVVCRPFLAPGVIGTIFFGIALARFRKTIGMMT
jgi:hypothetical protein